MAIRTVIIWVMAMAINLPGIDAATLQRLCDSDPEALAIVRQLDHPIHLWTPRPNQPELFDEQEAFVKSKAKFSICLGGTGSGKTDAAAYKTAKYVLDTPPPRKRCPFWVIGGSYEMVASICWEEKLSKFIPAGMVESIDWMNRARNWPSAVNLKTGWVLEFKSYEQGRQKFQGRSIGGYWFNEEVPMSIVEEVQGRLRDYHSPGWADFTPLEVKSPEWPDKYDDPPEGWEFFHLNTELNTALAEGWVQRYLASIPEDMRETRRIGVFASFRGQVFKEWRQNIHVVDPFPIPDDWRRIRGIDWGYNNPTCCLWVARDHDGRYYVYDEHFAAEQTLEWHAQRINQRSWNTTHPCYGRTFADHDPQNVREFQRWGIHCTPANKTNVIGGIELLRRFLQSGSDGKPSLYVFSNCSNLIREMRSYHWPDSTGKGARERNPMDLPVPFDDHAIDALRYAIYTEEMSRGGGWEGKKVEKAQREWQRAGKPFLGGRLG